MANKTTETKASVSTFLAKVSDADQRGDAKVLIEMFRRLSGEPAKMWGPSIIGFGSRHYRYASGHEGDICRIGFSPRKGKTVLYLSCDIRKHAKELPRLGKHKTGKSCIYIKRLSDIDLAVLEEMCATALAAREPV